MDPVTMMIIATAVSGGAKAGAQIFAGNSAQLASETNAFNIETQKKLSQAEALDRHNQRLEVYRSNLSSNIAAFSAMGRDVGSDRSVAAFLEKQRRIATDDTARSDFMGAMESMSLGQEAATTRAEGYAAQTAGYIGAFTTVASTFSQMAQLGAGSSGGAPQSGAPTTSSRPIARGQAAPRASTGTTVSSYLRPRG